MTTRIEPLTGPRLAKALPDLARLRIEVFRAWPYLYDGTREYESLYLKRFAAAEGSFIVAAFDGEAVVGVATASPIDAHMPEFARPLEERGFDLARIFYFGESVLLPQYRGRGIGHAFFDEREAHARSFGRYERATFCAVVRPETHPLKDPAYRPLDAFWRKRGYAPVEGLTTRFEWRDVGEAAATSKPMQYWMRRL
jgi:GNAT superfamily N-acetyltransferase